MATEIENTFQQGSVEVLETSKNGDLATAAKLRMHADKFGPRTLFCVAAGDGTVNFAINFMLTDASLTKKAQSSVLLPIWGGNGNDLASMLNGGPRTAKIKKILDYGNAVAVHPLYCRISTGKAKAQLFLAGNYIGFGSSGLICKRLNDDAHRQGILLQIPGGTLLQTILTAWGSLYSAQRFDIEESGRRTRIVERTIFNGPRVAKFYHQPVRLLDNHFYMDTWHAKIPIATPLAGLFSMHRRSVRRSKSHYFKKVDFTIKQATWAQFDGEPLWIQPDTKIEIGMHERPFYALSLELGPK